MELCERTCVHGGYPLESFAESAVKISEICLKVTDTAVLQSLAMSHRYKKSIEDSEWRSEYIAIWLSEFIQ